MAASDPAMRASANAAFRQWRDSRPKITMLAAWAASTPLPALMTVSLGRAVVIRA